MWSALSQGEWEQVGWLPRRTFRVPEPTHRKEGCLHGGAGFALLPALPWWASAARFFARRVATFRSGAIGFERPSSRGPSCGCVFVWLPVCGHLPACCCVECVVVFFLGLGGLLGCPSTPSGATLPRVGEEHLLAGTYPKGRHFPRVQSPHCIHPQGTLSRGHRLPRIHE